LGSRPTKSSVRMDGCLTGSITIGINSLWFFTYIHLHCLSNTTTELTFTTGYLTSTDTDNTTNSDRFTITTGSLHEPAVIDMIISF
jgi:hypothetical protein